MEDTTIGQQWAVDTYRTQQQQQQQQQQITHLCILARAYHKTVNLLLQVKLL